MRVCHTRACTRGIVKGSDISCAHGVEMYKRCLLYPTSACVHACDARCCQGELAWQLRCSAKSRHGC